MAAKPSGTGSVGNKPPMGLLLRERDAIIIIKQRYYGSPRGCLRPGECVSRIQSDIFNILLCETDNRQIEYGLIPPDEFIPFEQVCRLLRNWQDSRKRVLPISVNLSRMHLGEAGFSQRTAYENGGGRH